MNAMHERLELLQPYPFQKLSALLAGVRPPEGLTSIPLSIGEPGHEPPAFVLEILRENLDSISQYPTTRGLAGLRVAIANWLRRRFNASVSAQTQVLPVNGTREALFAFAQCMVDSSRDALVMMPNPFYQVYEGAAVLAGAEPCFMGTDRKNGFLPDLNGISESVWRRCQLCYACSPGNPTGAVFPRGLWLRLLELADRYDFVIAADECYSEIYADETSPPVGLIQVCAESGRDNFSRCVVFHSLSKRSNLPGLRSGFVAGDRAILDRFLLYRTYHGCTMPMPTQAASIAAWGDEGHVLANRNQYRDKYDAVVPILQPWLEFSRSEAGFYLWLRIPSGHDEQFARGLFEQQYVTVLPGSYLSRTHGGVNPGRGYVRVALVAETERCIEAARRIAAYCEQLCR